MSHVIESPVVFILFCDLDQNGGILKQYDGLLILSVFGGFGLFSQDFGQVLTQIMQNFVKMVRVCRIVAFPIGFIFL